MSCQKSTEIDLSTFLLERDESQWSEFRAHYPACGDCSREVALWSKLENALGSSSPGRVHPPEEELLALTTLSLDGIRQERVENHLADCGACRSEVAALRAFDFSAVMSGQQAAAIAFQPESSEAPLWSRIQSGVGEFFESIRASSLQPALMAAALVLLLVPVGLRLFQGAESEVPASIGSVIGSVPIAQQEAVPAPRELPDAGQQLAREDSPPASDPLPIREIPVLEEPLEIAVNEAAPPVVETEALRENSSAVAQAETRIPVSNDESLPAWAEDVEAETVLIAALLPDDLPLYDVAGIASLGGPSVRTGGFARSLSGRTPSVRLFSPEHVGWTSKASPTLFWELSQASDLPLEIVIGSDEELVPLLEVRLSGPHAAGVQAISLAEAGVKLDPNRVYRWSASLVVDEQRRSRDVVAGSALMFRPPPEAEMADFQAAPAGHLAHRFAARGYWYDAFSQLNLWLEEEPQDARLLDHRRALLKQVGLVSDSGNSR